MKLRGVNRLPLLVLAIAIAIAPGLHSVFGCADDEAPSRRAPESTQQCRRFKRLDTKIITEEIYPTGRVANWRSRSVHSHVPRARRRFLAGPIGHFSALAMTIVLPIGDLSGSVAVCAPSHPPPVAPIFLKIHSFLL